MKRFILLLLLAACSASSALAREIFPLNEGWRFFFKSERTSDNARHVTLPHSWNTDPMAQGQWLETTGNYLNGIFVPLEWASKRLFLKFYGVQSAADLFVNGSYAGSHLGGATAFTLEITDKIRFGADNALLVIVSNNYRNDILPISTDMNLYGGIYRDVELILTDKTAISPLYFGSDGVLVHPLTVNSEQAEGTVEVHLTAKGETNCTLNIDIARQDGQSVFSRRQKVRIDGKPVTIPFTIEHPELWSPEHPELYRVTAAIGEDSITDRVTVRTGFRAIAVTPSGGLTVNGERHPIHGVTLYHDNALSGGTLSADDYDADLEQIRRLGANALRSAVIPHGQYLYDRCDETGVLAWIDLPLHYSGFLGDVAYYAAEGFEQNGTTLLQEIIAQHINHPSVVMWGLYSCLPTRGDDVVPYLRRLNEIAHAMDPSRPTVACSNQDGSINFVTDLIVWKQEVGWNRGSTSDLKVWQEQMWKNWSHLRSGISYGAPGFTGHKSYTTQAEPRINWMPEERQTRFHEEYARQLQNDSLFWGVWIDNLFDYGAARRPYGVNGTGLVSFDRREYKDAYYLYKALWNPQEPTLHIVGKRRPLLGDGRLSIRVYSSQGAPLLLVGGDTVAMTEYAACQYRSDSVTLQGKVQVKALAGGLSDSITLRIGNVLKPKRYPAPLQKADQQTTD